MPVTINILKRDRHQLLYFFSLHSYGQPYMRTAFPALDTKNIRIKSKTPKINTKPILHSTGLKPDTDYFPYIC